MKKAIIIFITAANQKEADKLSRNLVEEKLAACATIVPGVWSRYHWQGKVEHSEELLLIVKTLPRLYKKVEKRVRELHSYTVPEILALPIIEGNPAYLKWIAESV